MTVVETLDYQPLLGKLLMKTRDGRVAWTATGFARFASSIEEYTFEISKSEDTFSLEMKDANSNEIFKVSAAEQIIVRDAGQQNLFESLGDLYEMARRRALQVEGKIATASELLDRI